MKSTSAKLPEELVIWGRNLSKFWFIDYKFWVIVSGPTDQLWGHQKDLSIQMLGVYLWLMLFYYYCSPQCYLWVVGLEIISNWLSIFSYWFQWTCIISIKGKKANNTFYTFKRTRELLNPGNWKKESHLLNLRVRSWVSFRISDKQSYLLSEPLSRDNG